MSTLILSAASSSAANSLQQPVKTTQKLKTESVIPKEHTQLQSITYLDKTKLHNWNSNVNKLAPILNQDKHLKEKYTLLQNDISKSDLLIQKIYTLQNAPKPQQPKLLKAASELEKYAKRLEKRLLELQGDKQMKKLSLQSEVQRRQQAIILMTEITKTMHDTSKAIIKKIK